MSTFKPLCTHCRRIDFNALRGPSATDMEHLTTGDGTGERFAQVLPGTNHDKVGLGTLSRIRKDSLNCPLCALFCHIVNRQGAVYQHRFAYKTLDSSDIEFRADPDLSYYARIIRLDSASRNSFVFRRLNLTAHATTSPDNVVAYFDNVLQVCDVGTLSGAVERSETRALRDAEKMPFGGRKRPLTLDLKLVHHWMHSCADGHGPLCMLDPAQGDSTHMHTIRLIDVHQQSIQEIHNLKVAELKFIALSYVWGSSPTVRLVKANRTSLLKPESFCKLQLPRTIADSMRLVDQLGLQYLWVDALCIIQDDTDDQSYQIGNMSTIYSSATMTIVAASGEDANAGLPGLDSSTRLYEQQEVVVLPPSELNDGLSVMNTLKSCPRHCDEWYTRGLEDADSSKWSHRAWTVQEKALSRRTLVFTNEQVFWTCQQAYFCEESDFEVPRFRVKHYYPSVHKLGIHQLTETNSDLWRVYKDLIQNYMLRDITYKGDVYAACQGILEVMAKSMKTEFLWGLPISRFELALAWETFHGVNRRTALSTFPMTSLKKRVTFPSWSWMGWAGDVHCRVDDSRRESENPLVVCFILRKKPLQFCHVTRKVGGLTTSDLWTDNDIQRQQLSAEHLKQYLPNLTEQTLVQYSEESLLFFWAHSAFFRVAYDTRNQPATSFTEYANQTRPIVQDEGGNAVGFVCKTAAARGDKGLQEFVAIGQRQIPGVPEYMAEEICPPVILALQIERDQYGISSRLNYAEIGLKVWVHANPKRGLVALQ